MKRLPWDIGIGLTVETVAQNGPAARRKVHADLMRATRDELAADERQPRASRARARDDFVARFARRAARRHHHPAAIDGIARERQQNAAARGARRPANDSQILLSDPLRRSV